MSRRRTGLLIGIPVLLIVLYGLSKAVLPPVVAAAKPTRGAAVEAVYATGTVEASVMLPIAPRQAARLTELLVDEGARVQKDQILAQLEEKDVLSAQQQAEARLALSKSTFERQNELVKRGFASRQTTDQARSDMLSAEADLARAKAERAFLRLLAPADGEIIKRDGEIGQLIPAAQPVFWLKCCAPLRVTAADDEEDIARVEPGQKVLVRADAFPGQTFQGTVQAITPKGDDIARSFRVRIGLNEEDVPLKIGMTAETNIVLRTAENALLVPSRAVVDKKVWLVVDGKLTRRSVELGALGKEQTEIRSGLDESDVVAIPAIGSGKTWTEGQRVRQKTYAP
jgi:RND family efflux transporter MFP subunit